MTSAPPTPACTVGTPPPPPEPAHHITQSPAGRRFGIRGWSLTALAITVALAAVAAVAGASLLSRTSAASDRLSQHIAPARLATSELTAALVAQHDAVRGYQLTGSAHMIDADIRSRAAATRAHEQITRAMGDDRQVTTDLRAVEAAAAVWRRTVAQPAWTAPPGAARVTDPQDPAFDTVQALLARQAQHLQTQQEQSVASLHQVRGQRDGVFLGILIVLIVTSVALAVLMLLAVVRPLTAVRRAAARVAGGELDHHIPLAGPADVRAMSQAVEAMRVRVMRELDASQSQEALLREQRAALDEQAVELRRSNAELEQFAYVASHDLQEPLRKVASFCQLLEKRYSAHLDERGTQYIAFAVDGAKRMQVLINDLLTFSRVGRVHDAVTTVHLDQVVGRALRNVTAAIEDSGAVVECPDELPSVTGDPTLLTMLWQNLIGNAIKFRHPDRPPHITLAAHVDHPQRPDVWRFTVTDNGIGIPREFADKVFVIFQRLHGRGDYDGTGIGLALCKKIVEHTGGRIWIDPDHTDGTRIAFTLPTQPIQPRSDAAPATGERAPQEVPHAPQS